MLLHLFMYSIAYLCEAFLVEIQKKKKLIIGLQFRPQCENAANICVY